MADALRRRMMMGQGGETDPAKMYLTFKALEDGTFKFSTNSVYYSLNRGSTWVSLSANTNTPTITAGSEIMWKTSGNTGDSTYGIGTFSSTGQFEAYGNIESMQEADNFADITYTRVAHQFRRLFYNATKLMSIENLVLPAKYLTDYCYANMFYGCTSITKAPELHHTTAEAYCCEGMFSGCTSLSYVPPTMLSATTLYSGCYIHMFRSCVALTSAPELPATTLTTNCYYQMFSGCTNLSYIKCLATNPNSSYLSNWVSSVASKGTFIANPNASWSTGTSGIPSGWTRYSSANYTRLLYSIFDHTCESLNTGVALFDGSLTAYGIEMSLSDDFDNSGDILRCSGDGYNGLRIITDGEGLIDLSYRPITYDNTLACESYDDLYIQVRGDRQHVNCYMSTNSDTLNYYTDSDWQYIPISQATLQYSSRSYLSGGGTINYLRIFEVPTYIE